MQTSPAAQLFLGIASAFSARLPTFEEFSVEENEIQAQPSSDKPLPNSKRRYHGNAMRRADRRFRGTQKMLALLAPAGVLSGSDAMWRAQQKFGL